jgi:hypothetical protein
MDDRPPTDDGDDSADNGIEASAYGSDPTGQELALAEQAYAEFLTTRQGYTWEEVRTWLLSVGTPNELPFPTLRTLP